MRILLATDGSEYSQAAVKMIIAQAQSKEIELRVLYVVEPIRTYISADLIPHYVPHVEEIEEDRKRQAQQLVERIVTQLCKAGFKSSGLVEAGDPKSKIIEQAAEWPADLIVLGSHGWKGLNRFLLGSVSEAVFRHAPCSVQVVRKPSWQARV